MSRRPPETPLRIALIGHHDQDYPRNQMTRAALEAAGFRVTECHSEIPFPGRHLALARMYWKIHREVDLILVTEGGHRLVPLMRLWAACTGKKLVFDPFLSRYATRIEDRRLHGPYSLQAWVCKWQDWSSTHAAHGLLFDTLENRNYFYTRYGLDKPFAIVPVGVDERVFYPRPAPAPESSAGPEVFEVFFNGTYLPLHGVEHVLEAARILQDGHPEVLFRLSGRGQTRPAMEALAEKWKLRNVRFEEPLRRTDVPGRILGAGISLGLFGVSEKGFNAVPNKNVQAAAMGAAILTADTPAMRRYFRDGESVAFVPAGNGAALAEKILELRADPGLRDALGAGARKVFLAHFSLARLSEVLGEFLVRLARRAPDTGV